MRPLAQTLFDFLAGLSPLPIYLVIGIGAFTENIIPAVPADTFALIGGFLSTVGRADPWLVFAVTWVPNVASALLIYHLAGRYGRTFFETTAGRWLLHPRQLDQIAKFYSRWGTSAIFLSRFLPAFRAMVPVFAGVSHMRFRRVVLPVVSASGLWYGFVVYLGAAAGRNWRTIMERIGEIREILLWVALVVALLVGIWWWRTRRGAR